MKNKKGFTLVELIIVLAVTTILLGTVIAILLQSIGMYKIDETKAANQDSLNMAAIHFESKVRNMTTVTQTLTGCTINNATTTYVYSIDSSTHVLSVNSSALTSRIASLTCSLTGDKVTFTITTINDNTGSPQSLTSTINIRKGAY